jgi:hypothetical protein
MRVKKLLSRKKRVRSLDVFPDRVDSAGFCSLCKKGIRVNQINCLSALSLAGKSEERFNSFFDDNRR